MRILGSTFVSLLFGLIAIFICPLPVFAQVTQISPPGGPDGTWCKTNRSTGGLVCGYLSAEQACSSSVPDFYPNDPNALTSVVMSSTGRSASCFTDRPGNFIRSGIDIGSPTVERRCQDGLRLSGGQCRPTPAQTSDVCEVGGNPTSRGNPIDLFSGIKTQSVSDFSTADGRFMFSRSYASSPYGTLDNGNLTYGALQRNWSVDMFPRILM